MLLLTFELPGGPIMTRGVRERAQTVVIKIFSFNPIVEAMPLGISVSLKLKDKVNGNVL